MMAFLRQAAGLNCWEALSVGHGAHVGAATGVMLKLPSLSAVQGQRFDLPRVIFADTLTGDEDIPENVSAVLGTSSIDVLSHVAIRARYQARSQRGEPRCSTRASGAHRPRRRVDPVSAAV